MPCRRIIFGVNSALICVKMLSPLLVTTSSQHDRVNIFHLVAKCLKIAWTKFRCLTYLVVSFVVDIKAPPRFLKLHSSPPEIGLRYFSFSKFIVFIVAVYSWRKYSICCAFQKYWHEGKFKKNKNSIRIVMASVQSSSELFKIL